MHIETSRLLLRRLVSSDAQEFFRTVGDPDVMRYWAPGPDKSVQHTEHRISEIENHWKAHGFGDWGVVEKGSGSLIGFSGLHYIANMDKVNIGYAFEKSQWRKGFGYETCPIVLSYGFQTLALPEIVAVISPENQASIRLAEKCGLHFWKAFSWSGRERVAYKIYRDEFLKEG